ncbi:ADP-ribosylation factor-binding protein GGA1 isoform X2 [Lethenteron reissneri]|uniref:ADP-ribosylation factor-binding protein GGA1 isoform X2 n=1 Tax=Lethenteron reissneri TaxID=7753 RepID=UPI002AB68D38|nr:ADP-ribosylation factor-binding protein GGA1 isoform X2 [Lethenteron reissneri]
MAAVEEEESLESWLNKATSPMNRQEDWEYIMGFCDQINKELEGPQIATRLLSHKAQSPQEWEALQALTVLEACMKNCDRRFHSEVGKFRFLNELIKVVSPKYLGSRASEKVKKRVIELIFSWTLALPDETKVAEAYQMLKKQGIVLEDPMIEEDRTLVPPPRPKDTLFEDEEKAKLLDRLLKSKNPEDLQAANRLIKTMVKEDQARMERVGKRIKAVEEVDGNVKLLSEMLAHYRREDASDDDRDIMKELHERCEKLRPTLFKLASETADNDDGLAEILRANDDLTRVMNSYRKIVENREVNGDAGKMETGTALDGGAGGGDVSALIELAGLDVAPSLSAPRPKAAAVVAAATRPPPPPIFPVVPPPPARHAGSLAGGAALERAASLLDDELVSLAIDDPVPNPTVDPAVVNWDSIMDRSADVSFPPLGAGSSSRNASLVSTPSHGGAPRSDASGPSGLEELDLLGKTLLQQSLPPQGLQVKWAAPQAKLTLHEMQSSKLPPPLSAAFPAVPPPQPPAGPAQGAAAALGIARQPSLELEAGQSPLRGGASSSSQPDASLASVVVPLESIKPSSTPPVTAYDKNGLRVLLHFAKESPPGRADVLVVVVSMFSTAPLCIGNIMLQAAVPKTMKVKLQPPSGTELPPFNPVLPPSAITQVMLLANAHKDKVRLRYKLTYTLGQQPHSEVGEVEEFPPVDKWGYL